MTEENTTGTITSEEQAPAQSARPLVKEKIIQFVWQHLMLLVSLYFMALGVALCVRSDLGSSVISAPPMAMALAGAEGKAWPLSIGSYTNIMNMLLVVAQIIVLRRKFQAVQLFQLVIGFVFGALIDLNMLLTASMPADLAARLAAAFAGCSVLALGIAMEMRCGSVTMPGEGFPAAVSKVTGKPFANIKIITDISLVVIAVALGYIYFGRWMGNVIGPGTLFAMIYVGMAVKFISPRIGWFDRLLGYRPGFRRYVYGLARYLARRRLP